MKSKLERFILLEELSMKDKILLLWLVLSFTLPVSADNFVPFRATSNQFCAEFLGTGVRYVIGQEKDPVVQKKENQSRLKLIENQLERLRTKEDLISLENREELLKEEFEIIHWNEIRPDKELRIKAELVNTQDKLGFADPVEILSLGRLQIRQSKVADAKLTYLTLLQLLTAKLNLDKTVPPANESSCLEELAGEFEKLGDNEHAITVYRILLKRQSVAIEEMRMRLKSHDETTFQKYFRDQITKRRDTNDRLTRSLWSNGQYLDCLLQKAKSD